MADSSCRARLAAHWLLCCSNFCSMYINTTTILLHWVDQTCYLFRSSVTHPGTAPLTLSSTAARWRWSWRPTCWTGERPFSGRTCASSSASPARPPTLCRCSARPWSAAGFSGYRDHVHLKMAVVSRADPACSSPEGASGGGLFAVDVVGNAVAALATCPEVQTNCLDCSIFNRLKLWSR